jgi:hypothetical protein
MTLIPETREESLSVENAFSRGSIDPTRRAIARTGERDRL